MTEFWFNFLYNPHSTDYYQTCEIKKSTKWNLYVNMKPVDKYQTATQYPPIERN